MIIKGEFADRTAYSPFACWLNKIITFEIKITSSKAIMPKVLEYFGFVFYFYSNEHLPIHVHVSFGEYESIFEILFENGKLKGIEVRKATGLTHCLNDRYQKQKKLLKFMPEKLWTNGLIFLF